MSVTLRFDPISGGMLSLYADSYPAPPGEKRFKGLGIHVPVKPKDKLARKHKKDIIAIAQQICRKMELEQAEAILHLPPEKKLRGTALKSNFDLFKFVFRKAQDQGESYKKVWLAVLGHLKAFTGENVVPFLDIDLAFVDEFRDYLLSAKNLRTGNLLGYNSAACYFATFRQIIKSAYRADYLPENLSDMVDGITPKECNRDFLTAEEIAIMSRTECDIPELKTMALFSALSGLRWSDINKLEIDDVIYIQGLGWCVSFEQKKTGDSELLPISDQAKGLLPTPPPGKKRFFEIDYYQMQRSFRAWVNRSGITGKHITFHTFRHSFATLQLMAGTDLYTLSGMLGHKSIKTTQVYAKVIDTQKAAAANRLQLELF